ncbi:unnamed protein product [Bursaphelenchus okinawaensis]|uniref:Uncharacterized protein n=1 Tax=Bursaphelenchus okinawaensis TaxID=465554 RepID=A0A811L1K8_9BILA|nr:unnamed protein product [Bursaphelenchus okinawaensis]CAG9115246.1 unnamed protein product [Bursaphelenchus okinawaensis]
MVLGPTALSMPVTAIVAKQPVKSDIPKTLDDVHIEGGFPKYNLCSILYIYGLFVMVSFILSVGFYQIISAELHGSGASLRSIPAVDNVFVAFGTTSESSELLKVILAAQVWRNLGVRSIVSLVGDSELFHEGPNKMLVNVLTQIEATVTYVEANDVHDENMAKLMPFYVIAYSGNDTLAQNLYEDTVIIVADTDYIPMDLASHLPAIEKGIEIKIYDNNCCDVLNLGEIQLHKYSMNTVAMTLNKWQRVFNLSRQMSTSEIEAGIVENYGDFIVLGAKQQAFYVRELAFAMKFNQFKNGDKNSLYSIDIHDHKDIHRLNVKPIKDFGSRLLKTMPLTAYNDIIYDNNVHEQSVWNTASSLLARFYTREQFEYLIEVRDRVISWQLDERQRQWVLWMNLYNPSY